MFGIGQRSRLERRSAVAALARLGILCVLFGTTAQAQPEEIESGNYSWTALARGFEVTEVPALADGVEVERVHLTRIDPAYYRFEVHTAPDAARELDDWMKVTGAVLIVNGSYFDREGKPATPIISRGRPMGPKGYGTKHGAFIVTAAGASVQDLGRTRWQQAFRGASEAMVSFPMLIGADGHSRALNSNPLHAANRSFIGQDDSGRVIIGTTQNGYFSLDKFALFLMRSGLELKRALNLDGGPPACQAVALGAFRRSVCSNSASANDTSQLRVLSQLFGQRPWGLPIVLAAFPK